MRTILFGTLIATVAFATPQKPNFLKEEETKPERTGKHKKDGEKGEKGHKGHKGEHKEGEDETLVLIAADFEDQEHESRGNEHHPRREGHDGERPPRREHDGEHESEHERPPRREHDREQDGEDRKGPKKDPKGDKQKDGNMFVRFMRESFFGPEDQEPHHSRDHHGEGPRREGPPHKEGHRDDPHQAPHEFENEDRPQHPRGEGRPPRGDGHRQREGHAQREGQEHGEEQHRGQPQREHQRKPHNPEHRRGDEEWLNPGQAELSVPQNCSVTLKGKWICEDVEGFETIVVNPLR